MCRISPSVLKKYCLISSYFKVHLCITISEVGLDFVSTLSEILAQSTIYHHVRQICVLKQLTRLSQRTSYTSVDHSTNTHKFGLIHARSSHLIAIESVVLIWHFYPNVEEFPAWWFSTKLWVCLWCNKILNQFHKLLKASLPYEVEPAYPSN